MQDTIRTKDIPTQVKDPDLVKRRRRQIADAAGLSKPNMLYYFDGKSAIHVELLNNLMAEWLAPMREVNVFITLRHLIDKGLIELKDASAQAGSEQQDLVLTDW